MDGWEEDELLVPYGPYDQRERRGVFACTSNLPLSSRKDVLIFETPLLQETVELAGPIEASFWLSSSAVDTDIVIKLIDVYPTQSRLSTWIRYESVRWRITGQLPVRFR